MRRFRSTGIRECRNSLATVSPLDFWSVYQETGGAIRSQALEDATRILEARAVTEGLEYEPFIRTGHHNGNIYLDLSDAAWRVVEVTKDKAEVIDRSPVKFLRSPANRALPEPESRRRHRAPTPLPERQ